MKNRFISFTIKIIVTIIATFAIHLLVLKFLELPLLENKIVLSYILNATLAIAIFGLLFKYREKVKDNIGFLFLIGSFLKFIAFFILIYPSYKADGNTSKLEFAAFFVPYLICLFIETSSLVKWLNEIK
jgi:hypothetical protein